MIRKLLLRQLFPSKQTASWMTHAEVAPPPTAVATTGYSLSPKGLTNVNDILRKRKGDTFEFYPSFPLKISATLKSKKIQTFRIYVLDRHFNSLAFCRFLEQLKGPHLLDEWRIRGASPDIVELLIIQMNAVHHTGNYLPLHGRISAEDFDVELLKGLFTKYRYRVKNTDNPLEIEIFR